MAVITWVPTTSNDWLIWGVGLAVGAILELFSQPASLTSAFLPNLKKDYPLVMCFENFFMMFNTATQTADYFLRYLEGNKTKIYELFLSLPSIFQLYFATYGFFFECFNNPVYL